MDALFNTIQGHDLQKARDSKRHISEDFVSWKRMTGRALGAFNALRRCCNLYFPGLSTCNIDNVGGGRRTVIVDEEARCIRSIYIFEKYPIGNSGSLLQHHWRLMALESYPWAFFWNSEGYNIEPSSLSMASCSSDITAVYRRKVSLAVTRNKYTIQSPCPKDTGSWEQWGRWSPASADWFLGFTAWWCYCATEMAQGVSC